MIEKNAIKNMACLKIKVGAANDIETLTALRKHTNALFYVDANAAWTLEEALAKIPQMKELGVVLVEQPLAKDNWDGMKVLYKESSLSLFADESCVFENDVEKCFEHFHGINIKLTKLQRHNSGFTNDKKKQEVLNMKVMMGCMSESTIALLPLHISFLSLIL
jgi:L-alanine-DL-glutamate epimerase-like enolase superfamily enzyme